MPKKFYITTPIYYTNAPAHLGGAYTTLAADVLARYHRLKGEKVFFLTGTDEHGQKIQEAAEKAGLKPKQFVDSIVIKWKEVFKLLNISNDHFIRTTDHGHIKEVKKLLQTLYDKDLIYKGSYESYYCVGCEQYLSKSDLVDGKCSLHKREPELKKEEAYLFRLSKFQNKLLSLINTEEYKILPEKRRKEIILFIEKGLEDVSFSRLKEKVYWGIELPFDTKHCVWVWADAFWNYVTGLTEKNSFDTFWPPDIQLMAKDILRVHSTIWPAMLLGANYKLPKTIFAHGYFTVDGQKMSKSLGNVMDPIELVQKYGSESVRYFLMRNISFGEDGDVSEELLIKRHNNELANDLGNLVFRSTSMIDKYFQGCVPNGKNQLKWDISKIEHYMENYELHLALSEIWRYVQEINRYINKEKPWESNNKEEILYTVIDSIRIVSILLSPFIPETSEKISQQLGFSIKSIKECKPNLLKTETKIKKGEILFKKIE